MGKFPDGRIKLDLHFNDKQIKKYVCTIRWDDVRKIFLEAYEIEKVNQPESAELERFKEYATHITKSEQRIKGEKPINASVFYGIFKSIQDNKIIIHDQDGNHFVPIPSDLIIDANWLADNANGFFKIVIINDETVLFERLN